MTTGSFTNNSLVPASGGGHWGLYHFKSWSGADRPKMGRSPHNTYTTYREHTDRAGIRHRREFTFRIPHPASSQNRVVKRAYEEEHAYTMTGMRRFHDRISYTVPSNYSVWSVMDMHGATTWAAANLFDANDQIKLVGKLQDLLYGSDFNLGVFVGELGPALDLIGDTAGKVGKAYGQARRGDFAGAAGTLLQGTRNGPKRAHPDLRDEFRKKGSHKKALADNWLELQYGWLPLLKDTEAAAQMLAHHLNVPMRQTYRVHRHKESNLTRVTQVGYNPAHTAEGRSTRAHDRWITAKIQESGSIPQFLGLTNPELVAWELLPWSFVADWFIPIGDWMAARALVSRLKGTFITSDKKTGFAHPPTSKYFAYQHRGNFRNVEFTRSISTVLDVPMPTFKPWTSVASWQHCANAVGLLVSGFAGKR